MQEEKSPASAVHHEGPLVSLLCRSMGRPELAEALASISAQTYPAIEIVLVDAAGSGLQEIVSSLPAGQLARPHRLICTGEPLNRPLAANAALAAARGELLMFLDEDDWLAPEHVADLVACALANPECPVCYSGARNADASGRLLDEFVNEPFNIDRLRRDNYIPIHTALFRRELFEAGCRFDESLEIYEDWDFWLQCARFGAFCHLDTISAYYRLGGESNTVIRDETLRYQPGHPIALAREKVLGKWMQTWGGVELNRLIGDMDQSAALQEMHEQLKRAHSELEERDRSLARLRSSHDEQKAQLAGLRLANLQLQQEFRELQHAHEQLDQGVREILSSFSWRAMGPYRKLRRTLDEYVLAPLQYRLRSRSGADAATGQEQEHTIRAGILVPARDGESGEQNLTLQAWAWSPEGLVTREILVDGQPYAELPPEQASSGSQAPVSQEEAQRTGFCHLLELAPGEHLISLRLTDAAGAQRTLQRRVMINDAASQYALWFERSRAAADAERRVSAGGWPLRVLICWRGDDAALQQSLDSIAGQQHPRLSVQVLPLVPGSSPTVHFNGGMPGLVDSLQQWLEQQASQEAYAMMLEAGECLSPGAITTWLAQEAKETDLYYSDHDELSPEGMHQNPWFTFCWSPSLLLSQNYIGGVYLIRSSLLRSSLLSSPLPDPSSPGWRYGLLLAAAGRLKKVERLAQVLWSAPAAGQARRVEEDRAALRRFVASSAISDEVLPEVLESGQESSHVRWQPESWPSVSIIIPTTGNMRWVKPCLDTLIAGTRYPDYEIVVLDNSRGKNPEGVQYARDKGARVIECDEEFNWSRLNNRGVEQSRGEMLLFLNDDVEIIDERWLEEMVREAVREQVGTVGSLLLYPNGSIQHAGVFLVDHGGGARHLFHRQLPGKGICHELDKCVREVSANTGACLMIARERFLSLGGFDESLALVGNDIDLCLRCLEAGYRNIWTPHSRLVHLESVSRRDRPIGKDEASMWQRWGHRFEGGDPCYNPNLTLEREDCSLSTRRVSFAASEKKGLQAPVPGVNLVAYIRAEMGVGEAARGNAAALEAAGIDFGIINYEKGNPSRMSNRSWQRREMAVPQFDITLWHINADHLPAVMADLGPDYHSGRYNIAFWAWELPEFPDRWLESMELVDEIWVPSTFVYEAIAAKSPVPVVVVPHVISTAGRRTDCLSRQDLELADDSFVFLSMFDTHSIAQRKNPYGSIIAFKEAFAGDDRSATLLIKVNNADEATLKSLREFIGDYRNIVVVERHLTREEIDSLIALCDCFVSLHHSEGFGLAPAEAMAQGRPAMLTNWSGNTQYMSRGNCIAIDYELKQLGKDYGPYEAHQYWAVPDLAQAAQAMRELVANPASGREMGRRARETILGGYSPEAIGRQMRQRLESIQRRLRRDAEGEKPACE